MMTLASPLDEGIELHFADGRKGLIPFADVPELRERADLSSLELPNPYEMVLETVSGERFEIPWDFARHYCDESYRPTVEAIAMRGRQTLGERVRRFRESAGLTQEALASAANMGRVTLVRIERGEQSPRYKTLTTLAQALGRGVSELLVDPV
ncbi:MAG: helix-turn-helix transcriptional regulator [Chloroflexota bacterium]|nr:helix-turn-helix transcriptional regulator [Chloroflexota bacterium]MDE2883984.1 helix-turn-helix transcriptional regulator [Chloroflexota bacterium]